MSDFPSDDSREKMVSLCRRIAGPRRIAAACLYGPWICGYADKKSDVNVLLIINNFPLILNTYVRSNNGVKASILTVDRITFERDVKQGWLGDFVADKVMVPYEPLVGSNYLQLQEVEVKKRTVSELLEDLVLDFPELSKEFLIRAEYFMYEAMMQRARVFPLMTYSFLNMLAEKIRRRNVESIMKGYMKALDELTKEKHITFSNGYVKISRSHINNIRRRKPRIPFPLRSVQRSAIRHVLSVISKDLTSFMQDRRIFIESHRTVRAEGLVLGLEEPKNHLFISTSLGTVSLSDKSTIEDFVRKTFPYRKTLDMKIQKMGGILNDVYLLTLRRNGEKQRFVVKRFRNWSSFKWFPIALWSLGTKTFAVLGQSRLEREYTINRFLHSQGFPVPKIFHVSPQKRLIFEGFISGERIVETIECIISSKEKTGREAGIVKDVGRTVAEAHRLGVGLGDCKPENFVVAKDGQTFFVDLEQATRNGNQAWDVAEFLYYSGHYVSPLSSSKAATIIAKNFIEGYLEAGGKKETIKKAASARYVKVFSLFTPPHVIVAISNLCQRMGKTSQN